MSSSSATRAGVTRVDVFVPGIPVPQGSKSAFVVKGRAVVVEKSRAALGPWRSAVAAKVAAELAEPLAGPVRVELRFRLLRPKAHFRGRDDAGALRADAPVFVSTRPDVDKLARAVLDALTGVAFRDDGQVAELLVVKAFGVVAGVDLTLEPLA